MSDSTELPAKMEELQATILRQLQDGSTQKQVAITYAHALTCDKMIDWKLVNDAIKTRWTKRALKRVKKQAWRMIEEKRQKSADATCSESR